MNRELPLEFHNRYRHPTRSLGPLRSMIILGILLILIIFIIFVSSSVGLLTNTREIRARGMMSYGTPIIPGTIYFKSDNEVDPFGEWRGEVYNNLGGGEIYGDRNLPPDLGPSDADLLKVTDIVHSGSYAALWHVGDPAAQPQYVSQVKSMYWRVDQQEAYYSTWFYFPTDFHGSIDGFCNIMQWKDDSEPYEPIGIVGAKEYSDGTWLVITEWKGLWGERIMLLPEGRWFNFQVYYKLGDTDGVVKVWVDGTLESEFYNVKTKGPGPNVMWGVGNYPDVNQPRNQSVYTDDTYVTSEYIDPTIWG